MLMPFATQWAASNSGGNALGLLLPVLLLAGFFFLIIRPQRQRARAAQQLQSQLTVGAEVMTTSGLYGTVVELADAVVTLEVSRGVRVRFARAAVARVVPAADMPAAERLPPDDRPPVT